MKHDLDYMLQVMQAAKEGKEIEYKRLLYNPDEWIEATTPTWDWNTRDYRIKPEEQKPEYVPYESMVEFLQAQEEHGIYLFVPAYNALVLPVAIIGERICFDSSYLNPSYFTLEELITKQVVWKDGTPFGKLKE